MDAMRVIDLLLGIFLAMVTWWTKETWSSIRANSRKIEELNADRSKEIDALSQKLSAYQLEAAERYARREDLQSGIAELKRDMHEGLAQINQSIVRVFEKLDSKADKS